jgi:hypothetical protein
VYISVPRKDIHEQLLQLLDTVKPTEQGVNMYCNFLQRAYSKQVAKVNKIKRSSNEEIKKLQALRQVLVEKNLAGTYSDDIFKEQNAIIEEKLKEAYEAQNDELINKYDINKITTFIKEKLENLSQTYSTSTLPQLRFLLSSIFYTGFSWSYPGYSNYKISPIYQAIRDADKPGVDVGCGTWIRTKITSSRGMRTTIIRSRNSSIFPSFLSYPSNT